MRQMETPTQFVQWLRSVAPYIHAFRGKTFVVAFAGELVTAGELPVLAQDLSLLLALGIKRRARARLSAAGGRTAGAAQRRRRASTTACASPTPSRSNARRKPPANCASTSRPRSARACRTRRWRMRTIRIVSGNFVTARPVGVVDGVDFELTGVVAQGRRRDDPADPRPTTALVLLSPLGFSPTGEAFNLTMEDVAVSRRDRAAGRQADLHHRDADDDATPAAREIRELSLAPGRAPCCRPASCRPTPRSTCSMRQGLQQRRRRAPTSCRSRSTARCCWNCSPTTASAP